MTSKNHLFSMKVCSTMERARKIIYMCLTSLQETSRKQFFFFSFIVFISMNHHCIECTAKTTWSTFWQLLIKTMEIVQLLKAKNCL